MKQNAAWRQQERSILSVITIVDFFEDDHILPDNHILPDISKRKKENKLNTRTPHRRALSYTRVVDLKQMQ